MLDTKGKNDRTAAGQRSDVHVRSAGSPVLPQTERRERGSDKRNVRRNRTDVGLSCSDNGA